MVWTKEEKRETSELSGCHPEQDRLVMEAGGPAWLPLRSLKEEVLNVAVLKS